MNAPKATLDFETRSACNLKTHGTWVYSQHPSTEILCLAYRLPHWPEGETEVWHPAVCGLPERMDSRLSELLDWIESGLLVEAHNSFFEYCVWKSILVSRHGWPALAQSQMRCSAAKAAARALPRALDDATKALHLSCGKDMDGHKLMLKMSKPRKSRKAERTQWEQHGSIPPQYLWHESPDQLHRLIAYCRQDVLAEEALSSSLPDLSPAETEMFQLDLTINCRGFQIDREAVQTALRLIHREGILLNAELAEITGGTVRKATQRDRMIRWFNDQGLDIDNTRKDTIDDYLLDPRWTGPLRRALEILRALGRSSTAKYQAMRDWMGSDGRVRGGLLYHGATTGRWAGKGIQPHNFPKGTLGKVNVDDLWALLKRGIRDEIMAVYPSVMETLSHGLRGAIIAGKGRQLYVADYAAIEARVLLWLADDQEALDTFREGRDIYLDTAESIYHHPCTKEAHPTERQLAKVAVLGLGYGMGAPKFAATCETFGIDIDEEFAQQIVTAYREKFYLVKQLWYDMEQAAVDALHKDNENVEVECGSVAWRLDGSFLLCRLPSGRDLSYPFPQLKPRKTPWGDTKLTLTFMGFNDKTKQWERQHTYGGKLVENVTQAVARDILAEAMLRCDSSIYKPVLSVHDEIVAEAPLLQGSTAAFDQLMTQAPTWAPDCPIAVESWAGTRYHK